MLRILHITNMYPTASRPYSGIFVKNQIDSLGGYVEQRIRCIGRSFGGYRKIFSCKEDVLWAQAVHCHFGHTGSLALFWKFIKNKPLIVTYCGSDLLGRRGVKDRALTAINVFLSRYADYAIAMSAGLAQKLQTRRKQVIPHGINLHLFRGMDRGEARKEVGLGDYSGKVILFLGQRKNPVKNFSLFLAALGRLNFQFKYLALENIPYEKVSYYMNAADVCVSTSFYEGSPNVIKEAMACARPVVSVDVGDVKGLLQGIEGCFVTRHDPGDLAEAITLALGFKNICSRQRILDLGLDLESVAKKILDVYQNILPG